MEPRIIYKPAFTVVGFAQTVNGGSGGDYEDLWEQLAARFHEIPHADPDVGYGVHITQDKEHRYLAGLGVTGPAGAVPEDMTAYRMAPQTYAVFTHQGWMANLPETVAAIYANWLPETGYVPAAAYFFEFYDDHYQPESALSTVFIWVPVVPARPADTEQDS